MAGTAPTTPTTGAPAPTPAQQAAQQTGTVNQQPAAIYPPSTGPDNTIWTVVIAFLGILVHILDGLRTNGFSQFGVRFAIYSSLFFFGWGLKAFRPHGTTWENMWESLKLNVFALVYPMILLFVLGSTNFITSLWGGGHIVDPNLIAILIWFFPPYFFYFVLIREWESPWPGRFREFYVWMWIIIGVLLFWGMLHSIILENGVSEIPFLYDEGQGTDIGSAFDKFVTLALNAGANGLELITSTVSGLLTGTTQYGQQALYEATGGALFAGSVERNAEVELGVAFKNLENADPQSYITDPLRVYGVLAIAPIQDDSTDLDPLKINSVSCFWGDNENATIGKGTLIPPENQITREDYYVEEEIDVDCDFDQETVAEIGRGPKVVTFQTEYDFTTLGYIKGYTIERELSRALRRERVDPFDQYGITDKEPQAIHTNGPMMIGMDLPNLPIEIDRTLGDPASAAANRFTLGISLSNRWPGKVKSFESLTLGLPEGMKILANDCAGVKFTEGTPENGNVAWTAIGSGPTASEADKKNLNEPFETLFSGLIPHKTIRCDIAIEGEEDIDTVLGTSPIETKYFSVDLAYTYEAQESLPINILIPPGADVPQTSLTVAVGDEGWDLWQALGLRDLKCGETINADLQALQKAKLKFSLGGAGADGRYRWRASYQGFANQEQTIPTDLIRSEWQIHDESVLVFPPDEGDLQAAFKGAITHGEYNIEVQAINALGVSGTIETCDFRYYNESPKTVTTVAKNTAPLFKAWLDNQGKTVDDLVQDSPNLLQQFLNSDSDAILGELYQKTKYATAVIRETLLIYEPSDQVLAIAVQLDSWMLSEEATTTNALVGEDRELLAKLLFEEFIDSDLASDPAIKSVAMDNKEEIINKLLEINET